MLPTCKLMASKKNELTLIFEKVSQLNRLADAQVSTSIGITNSFTLIMTLISSDRLWFKRYIDSKSKSSASSSALNVSLRFYAFRILLHDIWRLCSNILSSNYLSTYFLNVPSPVTIKRSLFMNELILTLCFSEQWKHENSLCLIILITFK